MKQSLRIKRKLLRQAYLDAEKTMYLAMPNGEFRLVKDWDHDPAVIWRGVVKDPSLSKNYEIKIRYELNYPYCRPKVFPIDKCVRDNRHQNPTPRRSDEPGDICIFQDNLDDWIVGTTCEDIIKRSKKWFRKYEDGTLENEPAPPEIERYYPTDVKLAKPRVILAKSLTDPEGEASGRFLWVPMKSGVFSLMAILKNTEMFDSLKEEILRLAVLVLPRDLVDTDAMIQGYWYRVRREPFPPPLTCSGLIRFLAKHAANGNLNERSICQHYINEPLPLVAICYPTSFADVHWLIYRFDFVQPRLKDGVIRGFRKQTQHTEILRQNENKDLKLYPTHHLSKESLFRRISDPTIKIMDKASVLLLGCGTIGSNIADLLVKSGLGRIIVVDKDEVKVGNVCRHVLGLDKLGWSKAVALKEHLLQRNPFAEIVEFSQDILGADEWLSNTIQQTDLVISCIGQDSVESWINQVAMYLSKPTLFCRTYAHATIGEILLARSGRCCFECAAEYFEKANCTVPRPPHLKFEQMVNFDTDCGAAFIPASSVDINLISLHCARLAILFLTGKEIEPDYWIIRGRPFSENENWNVADEIKPAFKIFEYTLNIPSDCTICGKKRS